MHDSIIIVDGLIQGNLVRLVKQGFQTNFTAGFAGFKDANGPHGQPGKAACTGMRDLLGVRGNSGTRQHERKGAHPRCRRSACLILKAEKLDLLLASGTLGHTADFGASSICGAGVWLDPALDVFCFSVRQ